MGRRIHEVDTLWVGEYIRWMSAEPLWATVYT